MRHELQESRDTAILENKMLKKFLIQKQKKKNYGLLLMRPPLVIPLKIFLMIKQNMYLLR